MLFKIYDSNDDGLIDENDLFNLMKLTVNEEEFGKHDLREIVKETMKEVDTENKGKIDFFDFQTVFFILFYLFFYLTDFQIKIKNPFVIFKKYTYELQESLRIFLLYTNCQTIMIKQNFCFSELLIYFIIFFR